jgi:nicotinamide riboside kinase
MKFDSTVINFISAPGHGKSLCAALVYAELKMRHYITEYIQEFAKTLVWKGQNDLLLDQMYVTTEQYNLLDSVKDKVEFIVTDSPVILGIYYNKLYSGKYDPIIETKILDYTSRFNNIYIFLEKGDYPYENVGRIQTYEESVIIQRELKELLDRLNIKYMSIKSDKCNIQCMVDYILQTQKNKN